MDSTSRKQLIKLVLFIIAVLIGIASTFYTNTLVKRLAEEERKKIQLWAEASRQLEAVDLSQDVSIIVYKIIQDNKTIPVILTNETDSIITFLNLPPHRAKKQSYLRARLEQMKVSNPPIEIEFSGGDRNFIYFDESVLLTQLKYYPIIQLAVMFLFVFVAYLAFSSSRKAEQNKVWVGLSKETAHQLGTPISALMAWVELLRLREEDQQLVDEVDKDVKRLETIAERFSKIGSVAVLAPTNIIEVLKSSVTYLKTRTSRRVNYYQSYPDTQELLVPLNKALFDWVIENICKNAIDAMDGMGAIYITVSDQVQVIYIDIQDTGKGVSKSRYKSIFQPGFTTKKRGWGLGLSLAKRIIETYHNGKIFVKSSEPDKGTTFRIVLRKGA